MCEYNKRPIVGYTYDIDENFRLDIVEENEMYHFYIYHKNYGVKMSMYGLYKKDTSIADTVSIVDDAKEYIEIYTEEYINE